MEQIDFTQEELFALNELLNHFEDHLNWFYDVMFEDPDVLQRAIRKIQEKA